MQFVLKSTTRGLPGTKVGARAVVAHSHDLAALGVAVGFVFGGSRCRVKTHMNWSNKTRYMEVEEMASSLPCRPPKRKQRSDAGHCHLPSVQVERGVLPSVLANVIARMLQNET